jgi:hypothetical protein
MTISNIVSVMPRDLSLLPCLAVQIIKERAVESIDIFDGDQLMLAGGGECCVFCFRFKRKRYRLVIFFCVHYYCVSTQLI